MKLRKGLWRRVLLALIAVVLGFAVYGWNAGQVMGNRLPMPFGVGMSVVLSGSMEPELSPGDLVFICKTEDVQVGDVLVYQSGNSLVIHRLTAVEGDLLILQGDANDIADAPVSREAIKGRLALVIPGLGSLVQLLRTPWATAAVLLLAVLLVEMSFRREKEKDQNELNAIREEIEQLMTEMKNQ